MGGKKVKLTLPEGAQGGQQFRLRGKGMPVLRARTHGDLYVQIEVENAKRLTREQKNFSPLCWTALMRPIIPTRRPLKAAPKTIKPRLVCRTLLYKGARLVVNGCAGRMGQALTQLILADARVELVGGLEAEGSDALGQDVAVLAGLAPCGITASDDALTLLSQADAVIDFTVPSATVELAALAAQARIVHIIGTTGFTPDDEEKIAAAARHARIVKSGNMSLGVNLLAGLVAQAAQALGTDWDIEILDMHHRQKVDAPSGTALLSLAEAAAARATWPWMM